jgi:hypothetical protein
MRPCVQLHAWSLLGSRDAVALDVVLVGGAGPGDVAFDVVLVGGAGPAEVAFDDVLV